MTDAELARLEEGLRLTLPKKYLELVRRLEAEEPYSRLSAPHRPLWTSISGLRQYNLNTRGVPGYWCVDPPEMQTAWPDYLYICGYERAGTILYLFDAREEDPRVLQIDAKSKRLEPCEKYIDLESLYAYAIDLYRKEAQKYKKKRRGKRIPRLEALIAPSPPQPEPPHEQTADAQVVKEFAALFSQSGFDLITPQRKHSIAEMTADMPLPMPGDLVALYTLCEGGTCKPLNLRLYPLHEAVDVAQAFGIGLPSMGYFPFVADMNGESCFLATKGPLEGYVVLVHHDGTHEIKARSLLEFLDVLAKNRNSEGWWLEDSNYPNGRPSDHVPFELAGKSRTMGDIQAARALLTLAEKRLDAKDGADEYAHLFELALMLLPDEQSQEIIPLLNHRDHEVRRLAEQRLTKFDTPAVVNARREAAGELAAFVQQAVELLKKEGLDAHVVNGTDIRIDPGPVWLNVPVFFDRRHAPDVWDFLVERAKCFASLEKKP